MSNAGRCSKILTSNYFGYLQNISNKGNLQANWDCILRDANLFPQYSNSETWCRF